MSRKPTPAVKRRRRQPSEAELRRFESDTEAKGGGISNAGSHKSAPANGSKAKGQKSVVWTRKSDGAMKRSTTVHMPVELAQELRLYCAVSDRKISDVVSEAVAEWLAKLVG